jgi:hypothetical protein
MKGYIKGGGPKSRALFTSGICMEFDCKNRDRRVGNASTYCDCCIRKSFYKAKKK